MTTTRTSSRTPSRTPRAFRMLLATAVVALAGGLSQAVLAAPLTEWREALVNDFEVALAPRYPVVDEVKNTLYAAGAAYASLSGSGSAVFGIFEGAAPALEWPPGFAVWRGALA